MNDKEWKEYRRQADRGESPEVKTYDVLALLDERDELRKTAQDAIERAAKEIVNEFTLRDINGKQRQVVRDIVSIITTELDSAGRGDNNREPE